MLSHQWRFWGKVGRVWAILGNFGRISRRCGANVSAQDPPPRSTSPKKVPDRLAFVHVRPWIFELNRARERTSFVVFSRSKSRIPRS